MSVKGDSKPARLPTWRIVLGVAFLIAVVGPLLLGIFYSYFTNTSAQDDLAHAMVYTYPYLVYAVPFIFLLGVWDLIRRYVRKRGS